MSEALTVGTQAVLLPASADRERILAFGSGGTLYYSSASNTPISSSEGTLTQGGRVVLRKPTWIASASESRLLLTDSVHTSRGYDLGQASTSSIGVVSPSGGDDTSTINSAFTNVSNVAGGIGATVSLEPGTYNISGRITVPQNSDLVGSGKQATKIVCTTASAGIDVGTRFIDNRGGPFGGFTLDANSLATAPFVVGRSVERIFRSVRIRNVVGDGMLLTAAQNNIFDSFTIQDCSGSCVVIDGGAANNRFSAGEFTLFSGYALKVQQDTFNVGGTDIQAKPVANVFRDSIFERAGTTVGGGSLGHALGLMLFKCGQEFLFDGCNFAFSDLLDDLPFIVFELSANASAGSIARHRFHNSRVFMDSNKVNHTFMEARTSSGTDVTATLSGQTLLSGGKLGFSVADSAAIRNEGYLDWTLLGPTSIFGHYGGGTANQSDLLPGVDGGWTAFPYNGSLDFANIALYQNLRYRRDKNGSVWIEGVCAKGTNGSVGDLIGTLPTGYTPATSSALRAGVANGNATGAVEIAPSGAVTTRFASTANQQIGFLVRFSIN